MKYPKHIQSLLEQKERIYKNAPLSLNDPLYKKVCRDINFHLKKFFSNYEKHLAHSRNSKHLFSYIRNKTRNRVLEVLKDQYGISHITNNSKAQALAKFFASTFSQTSSRTSDICMHISETCPIPVITPYEVKRILKTLNNSSFETFDGIPQIIYKQCADELSVPLSHIFNISLLCGQVPEVWKEAIVIAVPKLSKPSLVSEFRPISINPTPCKVLERILRETLTRWFEQFSIIPNEQHGFVKGGSTVTQLLDCLHDWTLALGKNFETDVIYFDLTKAFDRISHEKLLKKLESYGIRGKLLAWFESYLKSRYMTIRVGLDHSDRFPCPSGLPQGGALSPLLFTIYTAELPTLLKSHPCVNVVMYADDIKIYGSYNESNKNCVRSELQNSIDRMLEWCQLWDIEVNIKKSLVFHIGREESAPYKHTNIYLTYSSTVKDLGVSFQPDLKPNLHISKAVSKALSMLYLIFRGTKTNNSKILLKLYKAYVVPLIEYASPIWNPYLKKHIKLLEKVQKIFTRLLFCRVYPKSGYPRLLPSYGNRLKTLGLESLAYRRLLQDIFFAFKIYKNETKLKASKYWVFKPNQGRNGGFSVFHRQLGSGRKRFSMLMEHEFFNRTAKMLYRLPLKLLSCKDSSSFKKAIKKRNLISYFPDQNEHLRYR